MGWWEVLGKNEYPLLYVIACLYQCLPDSNGHQERTFSTATWMDGNLRKRQKDATFEMKVTLCRNTQVLQEIKPALIQAKKKMAEEATRQLLEAASSNKVATTKPKGTTQEDEVSVMSTGSVHSDSDISFDEDHELAEMLTNLDDTVVIEDEDEDEDEDDDDQESD